MADATKPGAGRGGRQAPSYESLLDYRPAPNLLADRVIAITGAASGIGRALSFAAGRLGARLVALDHHPRVVEKLRADLAAGGIATVDAVSMNFTTATLADYRKFADDVRNKYGRLDALVNNAGRIVELTPFEFIEPTVFSQVLAVNLIAPFFLTQWCVPLLRKSADPVLVFSLHRVERAFWGAYGVAKAGQEALLHILADEYHLGGASPMRVVGIDTGPVATPERRQHYPGERPDAHPAPETVVGPYLYALGPEAAGWTNLVLRKAGVE